MQINNLIFYGHMMETLCESKNLVNLIQTIHLESFRMVQYKESCITYYNVFKQKSSKAWAQTNVN
jgi:hypothetical protein